MLLVRHLTPLPVALKRERMGFLYLVRDRTGNFVSYLPQPPMYPESSPYAAALSSHSLQANAPSPYFNLTRLEDHGLSPNRVIGGIRTDMKELAHLAVCILLVIIAGVAFELWGGWIIFGLVLGLPLADYLMRPDRRP